MLFQSTARSGAPSASAGADRDEHHSIKKIGRLVQVCAGVLVVSACLLVGTALQVMRSIDEADLAAERQRAANAIDSITSESGPLTEARATWLGRVAGLRDARLLAAQSQDPAIQQIPLLRGQGPSGAYLAWTPRTMAYDIFSRFAPIRLPIIAVMLLLVFSLLVWLKRQVADIELQRRLAHSQSRSDALTGLANRLALDARLAELSAARVPFAVLILDLDRFKSINDAFGHAAGDAVLREVGARLASLLGPADLLARMGGDEFVMLVATPSVLAGLPDLARQCINAVEQPIRIADGVVAVGISVGIVPPVATPHLPTALVAMADAALYRAKSRPGSAFNFAGDSQNTVEPPVRLRALA